MEITTHTSESVISTERGLLVTLTQSEQDWTEEVGRLRYARSRERNLHNVAGLLGTDEDLIANDILGAGAELVVAKALGVTWQASVDAGKDEPDVTDQWGEHWQVRWSAHRDARLLGRERDPRDHYYCLVGGGPTAWMVRGYTLGNVLFADYHLAAPDPNRPHCYAVSQASLQPLGWYLSIMQSVEPTEK